MLEINHGVGAGALALTVLAVTAQTLANFCMSLGLKQLLPVTGWGAKIRMSLQKPWLAGGVALLTVHFFAWCQALTLAPLSLVVPVTALSHVLNAALVGPLLGEVVTPQRWLGTAIIVAGILVVVL